MTFIDLHLQGFRTEIMVEEKSLEQKLVKAVKAVGGMALKFVSAGCDGVPDRLVLIAYGKISFVEVKRRGRSQGRCSLKE